MNEFVTINSKVLEKKIQKLYQELDMDKLNKVVDRKMTREEAEGKFYDAENK
jgi:hypothetical protein